MYIKKADLLHIHKKEDSKEEWIRVTSLHRHHNGHLRIFTEWINIREYLQQLARGHGHTFNRYKSYVGHTGLVFDWFIDWFWYFDLCDQIVQYLDEQKVIELNIQDSCTANFDKKNNPSFKSYKKHSSYLLNKLRSCYESALANEPRLQGKQERKAS